MRDISQVQMTITELDTWLRYTLGGHVAGLDKSTLAALGQLETTIRIFRQEAASYEAPGGWVGPPPLTSVQQRIGAVMNNPGGQVAQGIAEFAQLPLTTVRDELRGMAKAGLVRVMPGDERSSNPRWVKTDDWG
jgi:hypothetical protein